MSLAIETDVVIGVLLNDGWYDLEEKSFCLDAYDYVSEIKVTSVAAAPPVLLFLTDKACGSLDRFLQF